MNSDLGELLREGIGRLADSTSVPPGLAARARQRHHRRQVTVRAAAAGGTAVVAAAAVFATTIGASGTSSRPAGEFSVQTTARVMSRTEQALAASRGKLIEQLRLAEHDGAFYSPALLIPGSNARAGALPKSRLTRLTLWSYHGRVRLQGSAANGKPLIDTGPTIATRPAGRQPAPRTVLVDYPAGKSFHPLNTWGGGSLVQLPCRLSGTLFESWGPVGQAQWTALIREALTCHLFRLDGRQQVDGTDALRLVSTRHMLPAREKMNLWVNPKTYLPVRTQWNHSPLPWNRGGTIDFTWLPPTPANLANLRVSVPAGLAAVRLPRGSKLALAVGSAAG